MGSLRRAHRLPDTSAIQRRVAETLEHVADIAIRSLDRSDRNTAIQSILTLERVARDYWAIKEKLSPPWFEAKQDLFLGFPLQVVEEVTVDRDWVESEALLPVSGSFTGGLPSDAGTDQHRF